MKEMNLRDGGTVSYVVLLVLLLDLSVVLGSLTGCGGGSTASTPASSDATLTSIAVTPTNPSIAVGGTQQFTAKGTYSDGSTQDITKSVTWKSSNAAKAPIKSSGLAIGVAAGSFTVTATLSGKSGTATLTITNPSATLTSISVVPLDPTIGLGGSQQFFASGIYSDSSIQDVTRSATWTSSDTTKATVQSTGQAGPGLATGVAAGSVTIAAALSGKRGSTTLTVSSSGNATMIPLTDITSSQSYLSFPGGLYENVSNTPPPDHNTAGLSTATAIQPLDANGNPSSSGKIVFVSIGRSTAQDEFSVFVGQAAADSGVNHTTLVIANGALATARPCAWTIASGAPPCDPTLGNEYDRVRDTVLAPLGVTEKQVQITWIEEYDADPGGAGFQTLCDPTVAGCSNDLSHTEALHFEQELGEIVRAAKTRWPNLKQGYHSSRIYGGYSTTVHSVCIRVRLLGQMVDRSADSPDAQWRDQHRSHSGRSELQQRHGALDGLGSIPLGERRHAALRWIILVQRAAQLTV